MANNYDNGNKCMIISFYLLHAGTRMKNITTGTGVLEYQPRKMHKCRIS
jgi:hypothetical protein